LWKVIVVGRLADVSQIRSTQDPPEDVPATAAPGQGRLARIRGGLAGFGLGVASAAAAGAVLASQGGTPQASQAQVMASEPSSLVARLDALELRVGGLDATLSRQVQLVERGVAEAAEVGRRAGEAGVRQGLRSERFMIALLNLQRAASSSRPWARELQAASMLAAADQLPAPVLEVLGSHAPRGVPTEADLRERFGALAPELVSRIPHEGSMIQRSVAGVRSAVAGVGLASPPAPTENEAAIASIVERLHRGDLAGAVADATTLHDRVQPLLAGWLVQARARLAVDQALQDIMLRLLMATDTREG
jgi:hypothetical protein